MLIAFNVCDIWMVYVGQETEKFQLILKCLIMELTRFKWFRTVRYMKGNLHCDNSRSFWNICYTYSIFFNFCRSSCTNTANIFHSIDIQNINLLVSDSFAKFGFDCLQNSNNIFRSSSYLLQTNRKCFSSSIKFILHNVAYSFYGSGFS